MNEQEQQREIRHRLAVLRHTEEVTGNVAATCRYYRISRPTFYKWLHRYEELGEDGLRDGSSRPLNSPGATKAEVVGKIVYLRQHYHFGPRPWLMSRIVVDVDGSDSDRADTSDLRQPGRLLCEALWPTGSSLTANLAANRSHGVRAGSLRRARGDPRLPRDRAEPCTGSIPVTRVRHCCQRSQGRDSTIGRLAQRRPR